MRFQTRRRLHALRCLLVAALFSLTASAQTHRTALFVGNNGAALFYAESDARRLRDTFVRLGGLHDGDAVLMQHVTPAEVQRALDAVSPSIIFFSGNANDPVYEQLKQLGTVAFFDLAGEGNDAPPEFTIDGARVTAKFANPKSKESDVIGAGYFGYHLATALIGSADDNGDGRVNWSEAVSWSLERTRAVLKFDAMALPAATDATPLTDLAARGEGLMLPSAAPAGPYYVVDSRGAVYAETVKAGASRFLALPAGTYTLKRRLADRLRVGEITIKPAEVLMLDESRLENVKFTQDPVKGTTTVSTFSRHWSVSLAGGWQAMSGVFPSAAFVGGQVTIHNLLTRGLSVGVDGGYGFIGAKAHVPLLGDLAYDYSRVSVGAALFYEFFPDGRWIPFAGLHVAVEVMSRTFKDEAYAVQTYTTIAPGAVAGLKVRLIGGFSVLGTARVHYLRYDLDAVRNLVSADFQLSFNYEFR